MSYREGAGAPVQSLIRSVCFAPESGPWRASFCGGALPNWLWQIRCGQHLMWEQVRPGSKEHLNLRVSGGGTVYYTGRECFAIWTEKQRRWICQERIIKQTPRGANTIAEEGPDGIPIPPWAWCIPALCLCDAPWMRHTFLFFCLS